MSSGSSSSNDAVIRQQEQQAAKAERKEKERQERLRMGRERIGAMFDVGGGSYTTSGGYESYGPSGGPKMITKQVWNPNKTGGGRRNSEGYEYRTNGGYETRTVANPNYKPGGQRWVEGEEKQVAGLADDFYSNFKQSILDYAQPEVARQYEDAKSNNLFDLARRGLLRSQTAINRGEDIAYDKELADVQVQRDAEAQTAGLQGDMAAAEQRALSLLQQTEDPTAAANSAASEVNAIRSQGPQFNPLGELFRAAALGFQGYQQNQRNKQYADAVPSRNPYTSSGRVIG